MKYFLAIALIAAVASALVIKPTDLQGLNESQMSEVMEILEAIHSPSTDPTTAVLLEQMLLELLGLAPIQPPVNIPAIIDEVPQTPVHIPAIIDEAHQTPVHIPAIIDDGYQPIDLSPALIDFPVPESAISPSPVAQAPSSSPLVQIIVNVNQQAGAADFEIEKPSPVQIAEEETIIPTPVIVVDQPHVDVDPVTIVEEADQVNVIDVAHIEAEPVIVAPIVVAPAVIAPETLN